MKAKPMFVKVWKAYKAAIAKCCKDLDVSESTAKRLLAHLYVKLSLGHKKYGDGSFDLPLKRIMYELKCEAVDVLGWTLMGVNRMKNPERGIYHAIKMFEAFDRGDKR